MAKIKNVVVGRTVSVYFSDDVKIATMGSHKLMEYLNQNRQWTFTVERTHDEEAMANIEKLKADLNAEVTATGNTTFKFKVTPKHIEEQTAEKEPKVYVRLGRNAMFDKPEDAFAYVRNHTKEAVPANMNHGLTKTFDRGSVEGQIKSVFNDVLTYGTDAAAVAQKVRDFKRITDADERYDPLRKAVETGAAAAEGFSVTTTFKYLYLVTVAKELPVEEKAEASSEGDQAAVA